MIMIGPGTGIAPFRAFLEERQETGVQGKSWLFFGDQCASTDFLYREELEAMRKDWQGAGSAETVLRVDGGMVASDWTMQFLADILAADVDRPQILETTALGAAYLAGMRAGVYPGMEEFSSRWLLEKRFSPKMDSESRERKYAGWRDAVKRIL